MANQKPVAEVRIGRVKATIWLNGTEEQPRHNVTFSRLYKDDAGEWKSTQSFGAQRPIGACQSGRSGPHAPLRASAGRRAAGRVLGAADLESGGAGPRRSPSLLDSLRPSGTSMNPPAIPGRSPAEIRSHRGIA